MSERDSMVCDVCRECRSLLIASPEYEPLAVCNGCFEAMERIRPRVRATVDELVASLTR